MYQVTKLKNGMQVATAELPHMASVCVGLWVDVGGRHETREQNGAAHFIEHMLFKGTKNRNAREISEEIEGLGGYLNAFTSEENTCYYAKASSEHWDHLLDVLFDMFLNAEFQPQDMKKERDVILEENAMYLDQPHQLVLEKINEILWPRHPLGRSITGTASSLKRLNRDRLQAFRRQHYTAPNVLLVASGKIEHRSFLKQARRFSRQLSQGTPASFDRIKDSVERFKYKFIPRKVEQAQLAICFKTCSRHDPRQDALQVLNTILGENMSSRLFQVLREEHGLAYSVYSNLGSYDDGGTLTIGVGLDPDKLNLSIQLIDRELVRLKAEVADEDEVKRAQQYLIGQLDLHLENTENHMIWVGEQLLGFGKIRSVE
ncbi:MAG: insulinase family protein, partial [Verrucomicrobia bacterium]|nr:insulinase family protein [Verrucomicrobiota bacterium]